MVASQTLPGKVGSTRSGRAHLTSRWDRSFRGPQLIPMYSSLQSANRRKIHLRPSRSYLVIHCSQASCLALTLASYAYLAKHVRRIINQKKSQIEISSSWLEAEQRPVSVSVVSCWTSANRDNLIAKRRRSLPMMMSVPAVMTMKCKKSLVMELESQAVWAAKKTLKRWSLDLVCWGRSRFRILSRQDLISLRSVKRNSVAPGRFRRRPDQGQASANYPN